MRWRTLRTSEVIAEFDRAEVTIQTQVPAKESVVDRLFEDASDRPVLAPPGSSVEGKKRIEDRNALKKDTAAIRAESFRGPTPETEQSLMAELQYLRALHEGDKWARANEATVTGLLPQNAIVRFRDTGETVFIVKAWLCAALCWPAREIGPGVWIRDEEATSLVWKTIFALDEVKVHWSDWKSPLRMYCEREACHLVLGSILSPPSPHVSL